MKIKYSISLIILFSVNFLASVNLTAVNYTDVFYKQIRIYHVANFNIIDLQNLGIPVQEAILRNKDYIEIIVDKYALKKLSDSGYTYLIIDDDPERSFSPEISSGAANKIQNSKYYRPGSMGGYFTYEEIDVEFEKMEQLFPDLISRDTIGYSINNLPIKSYRFGLPSDGTLPNALFTALHHGREPGGLTTLIYFLWDLLEKFERNDDEAIFLFNNRNLYVVPVVNPDGYLLNNKIDSNGVARGGGLWRKNRRMINDSVFGVDLNRNYGPPEFWDAPNNGSEIDPTSSTYRGESPFSEPETKALRDLCNKKNFKTAMNFHSYGEVVVFPFAALQKEPEDSLLFRGLGKNIHSKSNYVFGSTEQSLSYRARGTAEDYMYFTHGTIAATAEIGNYEERFWASNPQQIIDDGIKNLYMNYQFLWSAGYNLRPNEIYIDFSPPDAPNMIVEIQNIGVGDGDESSNLTITSLSNLVNIANPVRTILPLNKADKQVERFNIFIKKGFKNGGKVKFEVALNQNDVIRRDTFEFVLISPTTIYLFNGSGQSGNWLSDDWGMEYDVTIDQNVLTDSPYHVYENNSNNYVYYYDEIGLLNYSNAILNLEMRWNIDTKYDLGIVQVTTDNGVTWEYLSCDRMVKGISTQKNRIQQIGTIGFHGHFSDYLNLSCSLKDYIGQSIQLRFGLLSDITNVYNGWFLKSVKIHLFDEMSTIIQANNLEAVKVLIYPNPVRIGKKVNISIDDFPLGDNIELTIYDVIGNVIYNDKFIGSNREINFMPDRYSPGQYLIQINMGIRRFYKRILVID